MSDSIDVYQQRVCKGRRRSASKTAVANALLGIAAAGLKPAELKIEGDVISVTLLYDGLNDDVLKNEITKHFGQKKV